MEYVHAQRRRSIASRSTEAVKFFEGALDLEIVVLVVSLFTVSRWKTRTEYTGDVSEARNMFSLQFLHAVLCIQLCQQVPEIGQKSRSKRVMSVKENHQRCKSDYNSHKKEIQILHIIADINHTITHPIHFWRSLLLPS
jgi:hypothetical protein